MKPSMQNVKKMEQPGPPPPPISDDELVKELEKRGRSSKGSRATLLRRLKRARAEEEEEEEAAKNAEALSNGAPESPSKHKKRSYQVSASFTELSRTGTVVMKAFRDSSPQLKKAAKTMQSRKVLLSVDGQKAPEACQGLETLAVLKARFKGLKTTGPNGAPINGGATHSWQGVPFKCDEVVSLCDMAASLLLKDASLVRIAQPCYVFGDLHGNYRDLKGFEKCAWPLGVALSTANLLFLGDYVDRGPHSVEVAMHLLAMKCIAPQKVFLLRGNHEDSEVNGNEETYGQGSFHRKCIDLYGPRKGEDVFNAFNRAFACMPIAAVVDQQVFCVHGGLPRAMMHSTDILKDIEEIPRPITEIEGTLVSDLLWNDPVHDQTESNRLGKDGFEENFGPSSRGPGCATFGQDAVNMFLQTTGISYIIRAHEKYQLGFGADMGGRVLTVFSSSHYGGSNNQAGLILINDGELHVVLTKKE